MIRTTLAALFLAGTAPMALAAPANLDRGMWETEMTIQVLGETVTETLSECMLPSEANSDTADLVQDMADGMECDAANVSSKGDITTFELQCPPGTTFSGGNITFNRKSSTNFIIEGDVTVAMPEGMDDISGTLYADSSRTGPC